jgi:cytochrome bd ubiquinol oxidase subunit II
MYVTSIAASSTFGVFPYVLPSTLEPGFGLTVFSAAAPIHSLEIGLAWFIPGVMLAALYLFVVYRSFRGKAGGAADQEGY